MDEKQAKNKHEAQGHERDHQHGAGCGHLSVMHKNHADYVVDGRLHHPHDDHCDDRGEVE